jgi:hypothetical protein
LSITKSEPTDKGLSFELGIHAPSQMIPLNRESEGLPLPSESCPPGFAITYGDYLRAVAGYFQRNSRRALKELLARSEESPPPLASAGSIELISEKHGALYSVSRLRIHFPSVIYSFAVNTAFKPDQQAFLQHECRLLRDLYRRYGLPHLPRTLLSGSTMLRAQKGALRAKLFVTEWFDDYHEFHLSRGLPPEDRDLLIHVWRHGESGPFLNADQICELYEQAAGILTDYLDTDSFRQIYPWHHAAGDFVLMENASPVRVRLITARDFRCLLPSGSDSDDKMLGSLHFFLNMCIRMRIDRLDGTGMLAWADPECLPAIIRGFSNSWEKKAQKDKNLPTARDLFSLLLQFTPEERLGFAEIAARDGQVEADETDFLSARLPAHVREVSAALEKGSGLHS